MSTLVSYALTPENKKILDHKGIIASERGATKWVRSYRFDPGSSLTRLDRQVHCVGYEVTRQRSIFRDRKIHQQTDLYDDMTRQFPYHPDGPFASLFLLDMHIEAKTAANELLAAQKVAQDAMTEEARLIKARYPSIPAEKGLTKHTAKAAQRFATHLENLSRHSWATQSGKPFPQHVTEIRGEYVAAKILTTLFGKEEGGGSDYQLKSGFAPGVGIDQIWAVRNKEGKVKKYVIVEAKGSRSAELGWPTIGQQMSQAWVISALMHQSQQSDRMARTSKKILDAIFAEDDQAIPVAGLVIQAAFSGENKGETNNLVKVDRYHDYNLYADNARKIRKSFPAAFL